MGSRTTSVVTLLLMLALVVGCQPAAPATPTVAPAGPTAAPKPPVPTAQASKMADIYFCGATQGGGGTWDVIGAGLGKLISDKNPGARVTFVPGEGNANVKTLNDKKADICLIPSAMAATAARGETPYTAVLDQVRGVASLYVAAKQFIVKADYPLNTFEELATKKPKIRIAVGDPGSIIEYTSRMALQVNGITYKDIQSWGGQVFYKSMGEAGDMLGDGLLDAVLISGYTIAAMQEAAITVKVKMVPFSKSTIDGMVKIGWFNADLPKSTYAFMDKDLATFGHRTIIGTYASMSEDDIYKITKAWGDSVKDVQAIHSNTSHTTLAEMPLGTGVPLHPGAIKYYKEVGVLK